MSETDTTQNQRIQSLETRIQAVENQISSLLGQISSLTQVGKLLAILAGTAIGVDVLPMIN
jgi:hypothetical protein